MGSLIDSCRNKMDELMNKNLGGEIDGWMDRRKDGYRET
jgi:hypothetical protein